jgi:catalase
LVGNNIPVFFIQDALKFPDFVHAVKPEPHNEMPQAASAHDTFWDFVANNQESAHMVMWAMSDRDSAKLSHDGRVRCSHVPFC